MKGLTEEALEREAHLRRLSELMSDCCWVRREYPDGTSVREWVSGSFERLTGYTHEEFERMGREGLVHPDDLPAALRHVTGPPDRSEHEFRIVTKSGEVRWLHERMRVLEQEDGTILVYGATRDITDRKRAEEALQQSRKLEALGKLAGGIAHDFNNVLMMVTGYGELLCSNLAGDDRLRRYASEICRASRRAASLTEQLLVFSRKQRLMPRLLDLNDLIREMESMLGRLLPESIEIVPNLCSAPAMVEIDPGQFQQVLVNLVVNSRDAMPSGGRIDIWTSRNGSEVSFGVRDDGCGMEPQTLERMFEPFFTTKAPGEGTGLGLAAVYAIVDQSGGHIRATSRPGAGTTIEVQLPEVAGSRGTEDDREVADAPPGGTETLLIVEDEEIVRELLRDVLTGHGYTVLEAGRPGEALALAEEHRGTIDLMITDVVMPEMDGFTLARRITSMHPDTKVLYMSGYTPDAIRRCSGELDAPVMRKPFTPARLAERVRQTLDTWDTTR